MYVTYNVNDIINYLKDADSVIRILYDANIDTYFIGNAFGSIHNDLITAAYDNGFYDKYTDDYFPNGVIDEDSFDEYIRCGQLGSFLHEKPYLSYIVFIPNSLLTKEIAGDLDITYPIEVKTKIGVFCTPN